MKFVVIEAARLIAARLAVTLVTRSREVVGIDTFLKTANTTNLRQVKVQGLLGNPGHPFGEVALSDVVVKSVRERSTTIVNEISSQFAYGRPGSD